MGLPGARRGCNHPDLANVTRGNKSKARGRKVQVFLVRISSQGSSESLNIKKFDGNKMSRKKLEGVLCLAPLPLLKNQEIDYDAVKSNIELLAKNKVHGFIAFGSTGQHNTPSE